MSPFPREAYRPLVRYSPDRRPVDVDLSDNTSRWGPHPDVLETIRQAAPEDLVLYPPVYADRLREAVARRFGVSVDAVATGCGSDDLLDSAFRAVCEPGEAVRYLPPTFSMIEIFARMNALEAEPVEQAAPVAELVAEAGGGEALIDAMVEGAPGLVYLCRPNNPTGEVQPAGWVHALADACEARGIVLLVDEAYADYLPPDTPDLLERAAGSSRIVVLRTLSKAWGMAGLRVGIAVGAPEVILEIEKSRGPYKVNRLAEAGAVAGLEDASDWVPGVTAAAREGREALAVELRERGLDPLPSGGNFVLLPLPGGATTDGVTAGLRERGVAVRPFGGLELPGHRAPTDCIRISVGPPAEMNRFLTALDEVLG
ncbi:MAG: histidinol-phosphate aminotransferase family protein [Gemmatimonadales bacterium]|nr:MAG: histidinol-phosphate aminotransferase family protein [Gemmatimonadales bacterium]